MNTLRSHKWFYGENETGLLHRGSLWSAGIDMDKYHGQPVIGIANTWSQLNNCNMSLRTVAEEVKKGIEAQGGIALEFPVISLGEELMKPSAMLYRNLLSMEVEENLRAYPLDGVVLLGNCDKTVPGLLMGALSANLPTIQLNAGPKQAGNFRGERLGSGTDLWKYWDELRIGKINQEEWNEIGKQLSCGFGACNTMGTASTMNGLLEALGVMPLGMSTLPVQSEKRTALNIQAGKTIVQIVINDLRPRQYITLDSFKNAISVLMATGGSTNAIIHLTALAGRLGLEIYPHLFDQIGKDIPCIANIQPNGTYLISDFDEAGGFPQVMLELGDKINKEVLTFTGNALGKELGSLKLQTKSDIIKQTKTPVKESPTIAILKGNIAPNGAVLKVSAASKHLLKHTGKAVVFENYDEMLSKIDEESLEVDENSILILKNAGVKSVPGMPEWGMIPIPVKLKKKGVHDMIRISDARMSGTSFGTVILHVSPEAALGGIYSILQTGDVLSLDVEKRTLNAELSTNEIEKRLSLQKPYQSQHLRGYPLLYQREVTQADRGCDFEFLIPKNQDEMLFVEPRVGRS
jgi:dihydroxy-acid dehydratase